MALYDAHTTPIQQVFLHQSIHHTSAVCPEDAAAPESEAVPEEEAAAAEESADEVVASPLEGERTEMTLEANAEAEASPPAALEAPSPCLHLAHTAVIQSHLIHQSIHEKGGCMSHTSDTHGTTSLWGHTGDTHHTSCCMHIRHIPYTSYYIQLIQPPLWL